MFNTKRFLVSAAVGAAMLTATIADAGYGVDAYLLKSTEGSFSGVGSREQQTWRQRVRLPRAGRILVAYASNTANPLLTVVPVVQGKARPELALILYTYHEYVGKNGTRKRQTLYTRDIVDPGEYEIVAQPYAGKGTFRIFASTLGDVVRTPSGATVESAFPGGFEPDEQAHGYLVRVPQGRSLSIAVRGQVPSWVKVFSIHSASQQLFQPNGRRWHADIASGQNYDGVTPALAGGDYWVLVRPQGNQAQGVNRTTIVVR